MAGGGGDAVDPTDDWLSKATVRRLRQRVQHLVNAHGIPLDEYTPEEYIEGEIEGATLYDFRAGESPTFLEVHYVSMPPEEVERLRAPPQRGRDAAATGSRPPASVRRRDFDDGGGD